MKNGRGKYNVIIVDWAKGSNVPKYWKAAASTNVVGALVANFIRQLIEIRGANIETFHFIGHSLGAHICGAVGSYFPYPKIGRITGTILNDRIFTIISRGLIHEKMYFIHVAYT